MYGDGEWVALPTCQAIQVSGDGNVHLMVLRNSDVEMNVLKLLLE